VSRFGAEQRFVADYLSAEVLAGLDDEQSAFLRGVAVLGDFTPGLCDAALQRTDSREMIVGLVREGHFVSRLEASDLFRIHPLFAEYALLELEAEDPGAAQEIHLRAARWLAPHQPLEALRHASAAGEHTLVAELLAKHQNGLIRTGAWRTFLRWARSLPDEVLMTFPQVAGAGAIGSLIEGSSALERRRYLHLVDSAIDAGQIPADEYVAAMVMVARVLALDSGVANALDLGGRAVELTQQGMDELALGALIGHGRALLLAGDLDGDRAAALRVLRAGDLSRQVPAHVHSLTTLALVDAELGRLLPARTVSIGPRNWSGRSMRTEAGSVGTSNWPPARC
jgi:ATP/maltotriose-dependent transcriptional regulator MalT